MAIFRADISIENCFNADMSIEDNLSGELGTFHAVSAIEHPYHGEYEVTPTEETQTLLTEGKTLSFQWPSVGQTLTTLPYTQQPTNGIVKVNGTWKLVSAAYKKVNGSWVQQSDLTTVFQQGVNYKQA